MLPDGSGTGFQVGQRVQSVRTEGEKNSIKQSGTVKYIGPVEGCDGLWIGVDWDSGHGRHDGTVNGKRYFETATNESGSLVLPKNLSADITLPQTLSECYNAPATTTLSGEGREGETGDMVQESSPVGKTGGGGGGEKCSICLEPISGEGFLDQCFHKFCYHCILQWSEMVISRPSSTSNRLQYLECPLCKTQYTSIIHDVSGAKFQRHYILTSRIPGLLKSEAHIRRQAVYSALAGLVTQQSSRLVDVVPKPNRWISCWVQRELQALMQEEDVDTVMHHVVGIVESFSKRSKGKVGSSGKEGTKVDDFNWHATIAAAVRPFIFECAERFAVELESFLGSGLDIAAYDQKCKLAACTPEPVTQSHEEVTLPSLEKDFRNTFDLYDEDVDEEFGHAMLRKASSEVQRFSSEESSETMKRQLSRKEDAGIQERKSSRKELTASGKKQKHSIKDSVRRVGGSNLDRSRSKHRSGSRKKRKRSQSSSSRSISPPRHKRRKKDMTGKPLSRKKRKHTKRKDKKASQEQKRKSHKSRSRKKNNCSSDIRSDSESSRSHGSPSQREKGVRSKARKKDQTCVKKLVSEKADNGKVQMFDVGHENRGTRDQRTRDRRKSHHHHSSSSGREPSETHRVHEPSTDNYPKHRQQRSSHRGGQEFERKDSRGVVAHESSVTLSPEAHHRTCRISTSTSPGASAGRYSWDARESSCTPSPKAMNEKNVRRVPSEISAQRSDVLAHATALESKLREQALANLMRHLSQKRNATESTSVVNLDGNSAVAKATQDFDAPSATQEMNPQGPLERKTLSDGGQEGVKEIIKEGCPAMDLRNVSEDVNHVYETRKDAQINAESTRRTKDDKMGTGYSPESRSYTQAMEEVMFEGGQSSGFSYGKATSLEGRDIVVELVVDNEPFDYDTPYRGSTLSPIPDDQRDKSKDKSNRELAGQVTKVNSNGGGDHVGAGKMLVEQVDDPVPGKPVTQSPIEPREESTLGNDLSDVEATVCGRREEVALARIDNVGITGELTRHVEDVELADVASFAEESGKTQSTRDEVELADVTTFVEESGKTQSTRGKRRFSLNDVSRPEGNSKVRKDGDDGGDSARFQQKSMSVTRGGESIEVSYKVYIPQRAPSARRRLQR